MPAERETRMLREGSAGACGERKRWAGTTRDPQRRLPRRQRRYFPIDLGLRRPVERTLRVARVRSPPFQGRCVGRSLSVAGA